METGDTSIKNERIKEVDIPQDMALLNRWTIPKIDIKTIYDYGWFDRISSKQVIKTTEKSIALNSAEQTIRLLEKRDIEHYKKHYHFMHIGMVHHSSPIEPSYGPARSRPASLHTLDTESVNRLRNTAKYVENLSVNPKDNIVRIADNISDKDLPTASEMDFDPNPQ